MDTAIKVFSIFSPFISAYLIYRLAIKGKRKETDFQKERELNIVLSNLLITWNYLTRIEFLFEILKNHTDQSLIPKKFYPIIVLKSGILNDKCFNDLDNSIEILKQYDPILYFQLEGSGRLLDTIRNKILIPFINNPSLTYKMIELSAVRVLDNSLHDLEDQLKCVAKKISVETLKKIETYIQIYLNSDKSKLEEEITREYYDLLLEYIPDNIGTKPTLEEFKEIAKTEEFKKLITSQFDTFLNDQLEDTLSILSENPEITLEELQLKLSNKQIQNGST